MPTVIAAYRNVPLRHVRVCVCVWVSICRCCFAGVHTGVCVRVCVRVGLYIV